MSSVTAINFKGGESIGSIGQNNNPPVQCPTCGGKVAFKGDSVEISGKKKNKGLKVIAGLLATAALVIGGMGCASKYVGKLPEKLKFLGNNKVAETCRSWCSTVKGWGIDAWNKVSGFFKNGETAATGG